MLIFRYARRRTLLLKASLIYCLVKDNKLADLGQQLCMLIICVSESIMICENGLDRRSYCNDSQFSCLVMGNEKVCIGEK